MSGPAFPLRPLLAVAACLWLPLGCDPRDDSGAADAAVGWADAGTPAPDGAALSDAASPGPDASGAGPDAASPGPDAGGPDAGSDPDGGSPGPDAGVPLPGFGVLSGDCGELDDAEWNVASPFLFRGAIDFDGLAFDVNALSPGGQKIWFDGNLGGSSIHSEIFSFEVLHRCELATLLKTEAEIAYLNPGGKKTDLLVTIDARRVGVSVTRAFHWPPTNPYTPAEAQALLTGKLGDVLLSAANAAPADAWERSILHVVAYDAQYADVVEAAFATLDPAVTADTILMLTVTDGNDAFVY